MIRKLARYILTAGVAALVDLGGFSILFRVSGTIAMSAMASWCVAALVNYALTSRFVFARAMEWRGGLRFVAGALAGFAINTSITLAFANGLHIYPPLAKLGGIAIAFGFNFVVNVSWVFHPRHAVHATDEPA